MGDVWVQLTLVVVLILLNAAFAGTELALVSLRETQINELERRSRTGASLARLARQPNRFMATIQIGITLAGLLASATAAVSLAQPLQDRLGFFGAAAAPASVVIVTLVLAYFTLVIGELAPKRIAMQRAESWGLIMARPLGALSVVTRPVVALLSASTDVVVRLTGGDPRVRTAEVTVEELREMVALHRTFTPEQRRIVDGAFEILERRLDEVLVPRRDVFVVGAELDAAEAMMALRDSGHSRAPVAAERNLDQVIGTVHLRDLVGIRGIPVAEIAAPIPAFPGSATALAVLRELQDQRRQMALVVNEHGGSIGIVTVEDLVEEMVGEIYDEVDREPVTAHVSADGILTLPGRFPIHDLAEIGVDLPAGEYVTVAGLILNRLQRIPRVGDVVQIEGWEITISAVERHSIRSVSLRADGASAADNERRADGA
jgi:putative hemolysin